MPALNSCGVVAAGNVIPLGEVYMPVVTHSTEHIALARPGEFLMESFHPLTAQPTSISSNTAEPPGRDLLHEGEIRQLEAGRIRGAQRRSDHIRVGAIAAQHNIAAVSYTHLTLPTK